MTDNIVNFPHYNLFNIPEALRKLAREIEENPAMAKHCIVVMQMKMVALPIEHLERTLSELMQLDC